MDEELNDALLDRYRTGECSAEERAHVERWLRDDPAAGTHLEWLGTLDEAAPRLGGAWDTETLWRAFQSRAGVGALTTASHIALGTEVVPEVTPEVAHAVRAFHVPHAHRAGRHTMAWRVAAVAVIGVGLGVVWRTGALHRTAPAAQASMHTYHTEPGRRLTMRLADGSQVTLGPDTRLSIPDQGDGVPRDVYLDGQAYFEVAHSPARPFRVHGRGAVTTVLGTRFDVRAYHDDSELSVTVAEGRVAVAPGNGRDGHRPADIVLQPGDRLRCDTTNDVAVDHDIDLSRALAWTDGRLVFSGTPLRDAIPQLNRWYNLDIHAATPTLQRGLIASFGNESATEMLQIVAASLDLTITRSGRVVTLSPRR